MSRHPMRRAFTLAATLSLLAGCASPTVPAPVLPAGAEAQPAPGVAPAEAGPAPAEAPVAVGEPTLAPAVFEGVASYRGEPLAGYTIRVYHLGTDEQLTQTPSPDGLAVLSQTATTDAEGRYRVELAGLQPGFDVRVAASSPQESGTLFATLSAPDAETPEAGQGAIDEESTLVSLLTEGASRLAWAAVEEASQAPAGYRVAQTKGAPTTKVKSLSPPQKEVLTAKKDYKAEVTTLAKSPSGKDKYALSADILDAANQTMKTRKAVAKVSEPLSKKAMQAVETKKLNAKITQVVSQKGIQAPLTKSAVKLVTALSKSQPASAPGPKPPSTRPPLSLYGTPLAVTVAPSGLPSAVVNTGTNKELDLATVGTSGGAALDAGFTAPAKSSSNRPPRPASGTVLQSFYAGSGPTGLAIDAAGDVYVASYNESTVKRFRNGVLQETHATGEYTGNTVVDRLGNVWVHTSTGLKRIVDGVVSSTDLTNIGDMALDASGRLWLARSNMAKVTYLTLDDQGGYTVTDIDLPSAAAWGSLGIAGSTVWVGARGFDEIVPVANGAAGTPLNFDGGNTQLGMSAVAVAPDGGLVLSGMPDPYTGATLLWRVAGNPAAVTDTDALAGFAERLVVAADGAIWGTLRYANQVVRLSADGTTSHTYPVDQPIGMTTDAAGNVWAASYGTGMVYQYAP